MMDLKKILRGELEEGFIRLFIAAGWLVMGIASGLALLFSSTQMAAGILIGGVISCLNAIGLAKDCRRSVRWGSMAAYFGGLSVRLGLITLAVTIAFLFFQESFSPIGLFIGLSIGVLNFYLFVLGMVAYKFWVKEA